MVGGSLAFVIGFIGLLNFINSILTGIISRQREFAMMQAIGMTRRQLTKLVIAEGLCIADHCIFSGSRLYLLFDYSQEVVGGNVVYEVPIPYYPDADSIPGSDITWSTGSISGVPVWKFRQCGGRITES